MYSKMHSEKLKMRLCRRRQGDLHWKRSQSGNLEKRWEREEE
jgi:hypothetical protein